VGRWLAQLADLGLKYTHTILEYTTADLVADREQWWIAYGRLSGWPLTNLTDGGDGALGHVWSADSKAKMRETLRMMSPERRVVRNAKIAQAALGNRRRRGHKHSEVSKALMSLKHRGRGRKAPHIRINLLGAL
jgi:hypothetical protein